MERVRREEQTQNAIAEWAAKSYRKKKGQEEEDDVANWKEKRDLKVLKGFTEVGFDFSNPEELSCRVKEVVPARKPLSSPPRFEQQHLSSHSGIPCRISDDALVKNYLKKWARFVALKAASTASSELSHQRFSS